MYIRFCNTMHFETGFCERPNIKYLKKKTFIMKGIHTA